MTKIDENNSLQTGDWLRRLMPLVAFWFVFFSSYIYAQDRTPVKTAEEKQQTKINIDEITGFICSDRRRDPEGTIPIDQMARQSLLPLEDRRVVQGKRRAERLLPIAKRLLPSILAKLATSYNLRSFDEQEINRRVQAVTQIRPDVDEADNAAWRPSEAHSLIFGTVLLSALRSDEATIVLLAHELTHAVDGTDHILSSLVSQVAAEASSLYRQRVTMNMALELSCELVGIKASRGFALTNKGKANLRRRLARGFEQNCVERDLGDENHLSPRTTMELLLRLEPEIAAVISGNPKKRSKQPRKVVITRRT